MRVHPLVAESITVSDVGVGATSSLSIVRERQSAVVEFEKSRARAGVVGKLRAPGWRAQLVHLLATLAVDGLREVGLEDLRGLRRKSTGKIGWVARLDLLGLEFRTAHVLVQLDWIHDELVESTAQLVLVLEEHEQLNFVIGRLLDWPNHMPSGRDLLLLLDGRELLPAAGKLELHQVLGDDVVENLLELGYLLISEGRLATGQVEHEGCRKLGVLGDELW